MRRNAMTTILVGAALAATVVPVASGSAAGAAPRGGCSPTWRQVPVTYSDYRTLPVSGARPDIGTLEPPNPRSVSVLSSTDVRIAGTYGASLPDPLMQRWTGTAVDPAPQQLPVPPGFDNFNTYERAQSFSSPDEGWVLVSTIVGGYGGQHYAVSYRWHDDRWTAVPTAAHDNPMAFGTRPMDVESVSATDAWLVGNRFAADRTGQGGAPAGVLIEHWDGTRWSIVDNPMATAPESVLNTVTALSANNVWAAGWESDGAGSVVPLVMNWRVRSPSPRHASPSPRSTRRPPSP